jgi:hypothetical protein
MKAPHVISSQTASEINELKSLLRIYHLLGEDITQVEYDRICELFQLQKYNKPIRTK